MAAAGGDAYAAQVSSLPQKRLPEDPRVVRAELENGLRLVFMRHPFPPQRFTAHLAVHAGSVDEAEDEQGIAHMCEHAVFLGSRSFPDGDALRSFLATAGLSAGEDANAYTDFRETVYTLSGPVTFEDGDALAVVLRYLCEIVLTPSFPDDAVATERGAVLSEARLTDTPDFRAERAFYDQVHGETPLAARFPIGKESLIRGFDSAALHRFHDRWYTPDNMTLYLVGDVDWAQAFPLVRDLFARFPRSDGAALAARARAAPSGTSFASEDSVRATAAAGGAGACVSTAPAGAALLADASRPPCAVQPLAHLPVDALATATAGDECPDSAAALERGGGVGFFATRQAAVPHAFATPPTPRAKVHQDVGLSVVSVDVSWKTPLHAARTLPFALELLVDSVLLEAFSHRITALERRSVDPPFLSVSWSFTPVASDDCVMASLAVRAQPSRWREAVAVAAREAERLRAHGLPPGELELATRAVMRETADAARTQASVDASGLIEDVMATDASRSVFLGPAVEVALMERVMPCVTPAVVAARARTVLAFVPALLADDAGASAAADGRPLHVSLFASAPTVCRDVPAEEAVAAAQEAAARGSAGIRTIRHGTEEEEEAKQHLEAGQEARNAGKGGAAAAASSTPASPPPLELAEEALLAAVREGVAQATPPEDVTLPSHLLSETEVEELMRTTRPRFTNPLLHRCPRKLGMPVPERGGSGVWSACEPVSGARMLRLSNGARLTLLPTPHERASCEVLVAFTLSTAERRALRTVAQLGTGAAPGSRRACAPFALALLLGCDVLMGGGAAGLEGHLLERMLALWGISVEFSAAGSGFSATLHLTRDDGLSICDDGDDDGGSSSGSSSDDRSDSDSDSDSSAEEEAATHSHTTAASPVQRAFEVVHALTQRPEWDANTFSFRRGLRIARAESDERDIDARATRALARAMGGEDDARRPVTADTLRAVQLEDAKAAVLSLLHPARLTVTVVGDFDARDAEQSALRLLGTMTPAPGAIVPPTLKEEEAEAARCEEEKEEGGGQDATRSQTTPQDATPGAKAGVVLRSTSLVRRERGSARIAFAGTGAAAAIPGPHSAFHEGDDVAMGPTPSSPSARCTAADRSEGVMATLVRVAEAGEKPRCTILIAFPAASLLGHAVPELDAPLQEWWRQQLPRWLREAGQHLAPAAVTGTQLSDHSGSLHAATLSWASMAFHRRGELLRSVLSSRLLQRLREKRGLCYDAAFSLRDTGAVGACGVVSVAPRPDCVREVLQGVRAILRDAGTGRDPVRADEGREARDPVVSSLRSSEATNGFWMRQSHGMQVWHSASSVGDMLGVAEAYAHVDDDEIQAFATHAARFGPAHIVVATSAVTPFNSAQEILDVWNSEPKDPRKTWWSRAAGAAAFVGVFGIALHARWSGR